VSVSVRPLTETVFVSSQIALEDVAALAADGFKTFVSHRPDGEAPGQPTHAELDAAAQAVGARFVALPFRGYPSDAVVAGTAQILGESGDGKVLMFCAAGMRSAAAFALAASAAGGDAEEIRALTAAAGYDLSGLPL
jgi:uncharacterized protein (TIGR01244 family)